MRGLRAVGLGPSAVRFRYWLRRDLRRQNAEFLRSGADDGWPLPPPELVYRVVGHHDVAAFYKQSAARGTYIRTFLGRHGVEVGGFSSILDFGCGCGRVTRQWGDLKHTKVHGADHDRSLIEWCQSNLTFAEFAVNDLAPPLPYAGEAFDFVYAISVFTHLSADLQQPWMDEMARIIRPGGYLLITTHGPDFYARLTPAEVARANAGEVVVRHSSQAGTNQCAAYHGQESVAAMVDGTFEIVECVPGHDAPTLSGIMLKPQAAGGGPQRPRQDGYLLRRLRTPEPA
jgi:SAM-dependent methyltransferase